MAEKEYNNMLERLYEDGFIRAAMNNISPDEIESIYIKFMKDENLPERWKIDFNKFMTNHYPEIVATYESLVAEEHLEDEQYAGDLEAFLEDFGDDRTDEEIAEDDRKLLEEQHKQKKKDFAGKVEVAVEEKREEIIKHLEKMTEKYKKDIEQFESEIERLKNGGTLEVVEKMKEEAEEVDGA